MTYFTDSSLPNKESYAVFLFCCENGVFTAEHGKYNFLTTKKCYENS